MAASTRWRAFVRWFRPHAGASLALGIGIAIGIGCRYPADWNLPDNTIAMFAAVIGALATAAAVVIGVDVQSSREVDKEAIRQLNLRMRVKITLQPLFVDLQTGYEDASDPSMRSWSAQRLVEAVESSISRLRSSQMINEGLDNDGLVGLSYIEVRAATVLAVTKVLMNTTASLDAGREPKISLDAAMANLAVTSNLLMDEVFELSGGDAVDEWKLPTP